MKKTGQLHRSQAGFTAVELLVGMAVFVIVLSIAVGTFVRGLRLQRNTVSLITVNDNLSLVLEQIAREVRTGREFVIPNPLGTIGCVSIPGQPAWCTREGSALTYTTGAGTLVQYELDAQNGLITRSAAPGPGQAFTTPLPLTSGDVIVENLRFTLGYLEIANIQESPRVTISLVGRSADPDPFLGQVKVRLQTTVARRF